MALVTHDLVVLPDLEGTVEALAQQCGWPEIGICVGVTHGDRSLVQARGIANVETGRHVSADTQFQIGSNMKVWTATAVVRLVEQGVIGLDDRVLIHLPELNVPGAAELTVRHLLTHSGGFLGDVFGDPDEVSIEAYVSSLAGVPQIHVPGEQMSYSNSGFVLLGRLLERATGRSFTDAVNELVCEPLGVHMPVLPPSPDHPSVAAGHAITPEGRPVVMPYGQFPACAPAGSTPVASAEDVLAFLRMHLRTGSSVLSETSLALMQIPQQRNNLGSSRTYAVGLGWMLKRLDDGQHALGHAGMTSSGFFALMEAVPAQQLGIVVLTNSPSGAAIAPKIIDHVLERIAGARLALDPISVPGLPISVDEESIVGRFGTNDLTFCVSTGGQGLRLEANAPGQPAVDSALTPLSDRSFLIDTTGAIAHFIGDDGTGRPLWFSPGNTRLYRRLPVEA